VNSARLLFFELFQFGDRNRGGTNQAENRLLRVGEVSVITIGNRIRCFWLEPPEVGGEKGDHQVGKSRLREGEGRTGPWKIGKGCQQTSSLHFTHTKEEGKVAAHRLP